MADKELTPERIEEWRKLWQYDFDRADAPELRQAASEKLQLCELALDGLRFRIWCQGACAGHGVTLLAKLLTHCGTPQQYREAIDKFIVERAKGNRDL